MWWDHRDWGDLQEAPAVVGAWPAPWALPDGRGAEVAADPPLDAPLGEAGARLVQGDAAFRVRVGASDDIARDDPAWRDALADPDRAGLTVTIADGAVVAIGPDGGPRTPVAGARALIAAVPTGTVPEDGALLVVAGLDADAAQAAAQALARDPGLVRLTYAVALDGEGARAPRGRPGRVSAGRRPPGPLVTLAAGAIVLAFSTDDPLVLMALAAGALVLFASAPGRPSRWFLIGGAISGLTLALMNPFVSAEGNLIIWQGPDLTLIDTEITVEEVLAGLAAGVRLFAVAALVGALLAHMDADRLQAQVARVAPRSALTCALAARLLPTLERDARAISEAARPAWRVAAPDGRWTTRARAAAAGACRCSGRAWSAAWTWPRP